MCCYLRLPRWAVQTSRAVSLIFAPSASEPTSWNPFLRPSTCWSLFILRVRTQCPQHWLCVCPRSTHRVLSRSV